MNSFQRLRGLKSALNCHHQHHLSLTPTSSSAPSSSSSSSLSSAAALYHRRTWTRGFVKVGDKVPVNFIKDGKDPVILDDDKYPEWVHTLAEKLPTKNQLIQMVENAGGVDGDLTVLGEDNLRRAKRLLTLDEIKKANLLASTSKV